MAVENTLRPVLSLTLQCNPSEGKVQMVGNLSDEYNEPMSVIHDWKQYLIQFLYLTQRFLSRIYCPDNVVLIQDDLETAAKHLVKIKPNQIIN